MTSRTTTKLVLSLLLTAGACAQQNAGAGFDEVPDDTMMDEGGSTNGGAAARAGSSSVPTSGTTSTSGSTGKGGSSALPPAGSGGKGGTTSTGGKGGKGGGGSGGSTGGTDAAGGGDDGPTNNPLVGLSVTFKPEGTTDPYDFIGGELAVINDTAQPLDFATLKVRYYFTNEITASTPKVQMNWAVYGPTSNTKNTTCTGTLVKLPTATADADSYIELTCDAQGSLSAGTLLKISWKAGDQGMGKFIQMGDWSYSDPNKIVVLDGNNIVWGIEP